MKLDAHRLTKNPDAENTTETEWTVFKNLVADHEERQLKLVGHRWMEDQFARLNTLENITQPISHLKEFKDRASLKAYEMYDNTSDTKALGRYLEKEIIDFYYKKSLNVANPESFELRYTNKN